MKMTEPFTDEGRRPRIVVAVSESPSGCAALRRAIAEARSRGGVLHLVRACRDVDGFLSMTRTQAAELPASQRESQQILIRAERIVNDTDADLPFRSDFVKGDVYTALERRCVGADLLIMGRGAPDSSTRFFGEWFQRQAACPVTLVDAAPPSA